MALQGGSRPPPNGTLAYIGPSPGGHVVSYHNRNEPLVGPLPSFNSVYQTSPYSPPTPAAVFQAVPPSHQQQISAERSSNNNSSSSTHLHPSTSSNIPEDLRAFSGDPNFGYSLLETRESPIIPRPPGSGDNMSSMMSFFTQVAKITDNLFLCAAAAVTQANIRQHGITHVINLTLDVPSIKDPYVETTRVSVDDVPHANLGIYFDRLADKIRQVKERGGRTMVHCVAGVSRSSSTCIAYLMKYYRMPLVEAYRYVKGRRPVIRPNVGFFRQLIEYERKLFGKNTVRMVDSPIGYIPDVYKEETRGMVFLNPSPAAGSSRRGYHASSHFNR